MIDSYSFGNMVIDGTRYRSDLKLFPDQVKSKWWRKKGHLLLEEDLKDVLEYRPDTLIIGTGANGLIKVDESLIEHLESLGIKYIIKNTKQAVKEFNKSKSNKVVGVFHLTC
ncbi:MAG: Mth938-like domain-containing protein [Actinomycetota bacterium]